MQAVSKQIKPFIGTRDFYTSALKVMIPVTIQQLINTLFNTVDNLMVGSLDVNGLAMSAVSVANRPFMIFSCLFFGMTGAGGLMISQYFGAEDKRSCQGLFAAQILLGLLMSVLFGGALALFPEQIMRIFISDPTTVALGMDYLRIIWLSYLPLAITNVCIFSMRSVGQNKASMFVSMMAMGINACCNYVLIFGKLGLPAMGVKGAAWGTLIARMAEMTFYLFILLRRKTVFTLDITAFRWLRKPQLVAFARRTWPLVFNEVLWSTGVSIYFWAYSRLSEASLPALTIAEQISQLASVMAAGTSSAVAVLIGTELGANRLLQAKANAKKLVALVLGIGLVCACICTGLAFVMPHVFTITPQLKALATKLAIILGVFSPLSFVYGFCFCCMRAGGDTRNAMLLDSGYLWMLPVPAAILMGLFLPGKMGLFPAVIVIQFLSNAKVLWGLYVVKKGRWVRNITND